MSDLLDARSETSVRNILTSMEKHQAGDVIETVRQQVVERYGDKETVLFGLLDRMLHEDPLQRPLPENYHLQIPYGEYIAKAGR